MITQPPPPKGSIRITHLSLIAILGLLAFMVGTGILEKRKLDRQTVDVCMSSINESSLCDCVAEEMFGHLTFLNFTPVVRNYVGLPFDGEETQEQSAVRVEEALDVCERRENG